MIWMTWRQHRAQALYLLVALAVLAAVLVPPGLTMFRALTDLGLTSCHGTLSVDDPCEVGRNTFAERFALPHQFSILLALVPLLVGLFAGAPLVARELEHGTHRLVWMQGVTRRRWLLVKIGLVLAGAVVFAAALSALVYWWWTPYERAGTSRFGQLAFDLQGLVPVGYTIFAVALGVVAGALVPKVLPAMAVTVAGFIGARVAVMVARPHFQPAEEARFPLFAESHPGRFADIWQLSTRVYSADGQDLGSGLIMCPPAAEAELDRGCAGYQPGDYNLTRFHPASDYWTSRMQGIVSIWECPRGTTPRTGSPPASRTTCVTRSGVRILRTQVGPIADSGSRTGTLRVTILSGAPRREYRVRGQLCSAPRRASR